MGPQGVTFEIEEEPLRAEVITLSARDASRLVKVLRGQGAEALADRIEHATELRGETEKLALAGGEDRQLLDAVRETRTPGEIPFARLQQALEAKIARET